MAGLEIGSPATPGWYADPSARAQWRYWDGSAWTPWVDRGETAVPDPLGAPAAGPPGPDTRARGLILRDIEPRPLVAAANSTSPGSAGAFPTTGSDTRAALWFAIVGASAVVLGVMLFSTSRPSTAVWDIPTGQASGILAALVGLGLLMVALILWLSKLANRPRGSNASTGEVRR